MNDKQDLLQITAAFEKFGILFQLAAPAPEYITAVYEEIKQKGWTVARFTDALDYLKYCPEYNAAAHFGKYPTIYDILDADWHLRQ